MRFRKLGFLALPVALCSAFSDTSPFLLFSTSDVLFSTRQIESPTSIADKVLDSLKTCPSTFYIFVQASGIRSQDFQQKSTAPTIHRFMAGEEKSIRSAASVNEVSGIINTQRLERALRQQCNVKPGYSVLGLRDGVPQSQDDDHRIISIDIKSSENSTSVQNLEIADATLKAYLDLLPSRDFTVLFTTTPPGVRCESSENESEEKLSFEMDREFQEPLHTNLKRDVAIHQPRKVGNQTIVEGPLFEKYQFFSPGLFVGFTIGLILLSILYVGISGLASLTVSYAAFDKETGPAAQKKQ